MVIMRMSDPSKARPKPIDVSELPDFRFDDQPCGIGSGRPARYPVVVRVRRSVQHSCVLSIPVI